MMIITMPEMIINASGGNLNSHASAFGLDATSLGNLASTTFAVQAVSVNGTTQNETGTFF